MKKVFIAILTNVLLLTLNSCTKLGENMNTQLTAGQVRGALGNYQLTSLLQGVYNDIGTTFTDIGQVYSMEENSSDELLAPTRAGDWFDGGQWQQLHKHTWTPDHPQVLSVFNLLNQINYEATNVLKFSPSKQQAAEARCARAFSLYYLMDLYGKYSVRNPDDNLLAAPPVKTGAEAAQFIIDELNAIMADLPNDSDPSHCNVYLGKALLMKVLLNRAVWLNRQQPSFQDADMQQIISLGNSIISSGAYHYATEYFSNFAADNGSSPENIFTHVNTAGVAAGYSVVDYQWQVTLSYNQYTPYNPGAGWNGYCTPKAFYNSFGTTAQQMQAVTQLAAGNTSGRYADTTIDSRIGGRFYAGVTDVSGMKPGFMIGQQYNENGQKEYDRKGNLLVFGTDLAPDMNENGPNLEIVGIRVLKYSPDFSNGGKYYFGPAGNDYVMLRYSDVVLMVAEAYLRQSAANPAAALGLVNDLRQARRATPLPSISLVNMSNLYDPNTLLCERGRELYWEGHRRTDLIRYGAFLVPWECKPSDNARNLVYPIPSQALTSNPNLKQNTGY